MTDQPISPPRSSREETPDMSESGAIRTLGLLDKGASQKMDIALNWRQCAYLANELRTRPLASSLSGIADMKRDAAGPLVECRALLASLRESNEALCRSNDARLLDWKWIQQRTPAELVALAQEASTHPAGATMLEIVRSRRPDPGTQEGA